MTDILSSGYAEQLPIDGSFGVPEKLSLGSWDEYTYWKDYEPVIDVPEIDGQQPMPLKRRFIDFGQVDEDDHEAQVFGLIDDADLAIRSLSVELEVSREESTHDPLTGLLNRRGFDDLFEAHVQEQRRISLIALNEPERLRKTEAARQGLALLNFDLNNFKEINDTRGHPHGDAVLQATARVLTSLVREHDLVCRNGGDEFLVVLNEGIDAKGAVALAARIQQELLNTEVGDQQGIEASIGISLYSLGMTVEHMLQEADEDMYEAKRISKERATHDSV